MLKSVNILNFIYDIVFSSWTLRKKYLIIIGMKKVLFIAPLDSKGRFVGGVYSYAKSILDSSFFVEQGIDFHGLSTCLVNRGAFSGGQFKFENIINFFKLKKRGHNFRYFKLTT